MNRRTFFASLLGASVAGTLGSLAVPAWARADASLNVYVQLIDLQKAMLASHDTWKAGPAFAYVPELDDPWEKRRHYSGAYKFDVEQRVADRVAARKAYDLVPVDAVLAHLNAHFTPVTAEEDFAAHAAANREVRALFNGEIEIDTMSEASMRRVLKSTVAVAVVKAMLSVHKMPLNPSKMANFDEFARKFRSIIL